ncbi:MAG: hypothetical protein Q9209_001766 [Squamulea sp. 1 TL-2023]
MEAVLGIGRTSTQTTLASVETNAPGNRSLRSELSGQDDQALPAPAQSPPLRVDTSGTSGQLSTIAEGVSPAQPSSAVLTPVVSGDLRSERSLSHEWIPNPRILSDQEHGKSERAQPETNAPIQTENLSKPSGGFWIRQSQRRLRERIRQHLRKPRSFNISRLGLHVDVSPTPAAPCRPLPFTTNAYPAAAHDALNEPPPTSMAFIEPRPDLTSVQLTPVRSHSVSTHSGESPQQPSTAHPDPLIGRTLTLSEKHERIRALRREATLKRQAEFISRCECQSQCHCRNGSAQSNAASLGPEPSERSFQVPVHHLHRLFSEAGGSSTSGGSSSGVPEGSFLAGVGSHLHPEQDVILTDRWTNQAMENHPIYNDRLSQASTVCFRSNGSSVSLSSRGPASLRRSSTTPASVPRRSTDGLRPDLVEVLRNRNIPDLDHGPGPEAPSSPRGSVSEAENSSGQAVDARNGAR